MELHRACSSRGKVHADTLDLNVRGQATAEKSFMVRWSRYV